MHYLGWVPLGRLQAPLGVQEERVADHDLFAFLQARKDHDRTKEVPAEPGRVTGVEDPPYIAGPAAATCGPPAQRPRVRPRAPTPHNAGRGRKRPSRAEPER